MVNSIYLNQISSLFSSSFMTRIIEGNYYDILKYTVNESGFYKGDLFKLELVNILDRMHSFLLKHYRCEYIYKNAIASKILLGKYSLKTSTLLSEFRANESKADIVIINGTSNVYEIKTELDSLNRLKRQLESYSNMFDKISVVTYEENTEKLLKVLPKGIGVLVLTKKYTLKEILKPDSNEKNVNPSIIFDSLTKKEYLSIIKDEFGYIPSVPNTIIYDVCKRMFCSLSPKKSHIMMIKALKKRRISNYQEGIVNSAPESLKLFCLSKSLSKKGCEVFEERIFSKINNRRV